MEVAGKLSFSKQLMFVVCLCAFVMIQWLFILPNMGYEYLHV